MPMLRSLRAAFDTVRGQAGVRQEALGRVRREAESLLAIARVVGGPNSLQEALRLLCRELAHLTGADTVAAYVLDPLGVELRPCAAYHVPKALLPALATLRVPLAEQGFRDEVVVHGRPVWSEDVAHDPRFGFEAFRQFAHQSSLMLPLLIDDAPRPAGGAPMAGQVSGAFYLVWWTARRHFDEAELTTLQAVGQQVGILLHNARLYAEAQRREREVRILFEFTRRIAATLDLDEVLDIIMACVTETVGCDAAAVFRWEAASGELVAARSRNLDASVVRALRFRAGEGVSGRAFAERRAVWTGDRATDPELRLREETDAVLRRATHRHPAMVGVPIVIRDDVYGVLLAHRSAPHDWRDDEIRLVSQLAASAAVAIENARLYAETQQNLAGAGLLHDAARMLHRIRDVRQRLPAALADLGRTFGATGAAVTVFAGPGVESDQTIAWGAAACAGVGLVALLFRQREAPLLVADVRTLGVAVPGTTLSAEVESLAAFPVRGRRRILGALFLLFGARRELSAVEQRLLAAYADQLAMALDNAALFEEIENQKTLFEHIFASTSDGLLFLDRAGLIAALNRRGEELLGVVARQVVGEPVEHLVQTLGDRAVWTSAEGFGLRDIVDDPIQEATGDLEVRAPHVLTLRWHASPARDAQGARVGVTVTLQDVTREREVARMKTEFVSTVSHELRTPLTSIKGALHLFGEADQELDPTRRALLDICLSNADRLIRLINDILDISRIEAGGLPLTLAWRGVSEFVAPALDSVRAFAGSRGVEVVNALVDDLPRVQVDLDRMVQVMTNLLSNAIKFSPPGTQVVVTAAASHGAVEVRVVDQGRGIAPADVLRLFQKFQQLDARTVREAGGTGLGLAICRGLIKEHGGDIRVESALGRGSTFTVTLRAAMAPPPLAPAEGERSAG